MENPYVQYLFLFHKGFVEDLYIFRDHYFEHHSIDDAENKNRHVLSEMDKILEVMKKNKDSYESEDRSQFCLLKGKVLNVKSEFDPVALEVLSKAVKLNPKLVEGWNELGECYWKNGDIQAAKNCFEGAIKQSVNATSLRNLSMVLRQIGSTSQEKMANVQQSVEKAREAVNLNIQDGKSWYILGNAHLSLFFSTTQNPAMLKQCMSAYHQAMQDTAMKCNPDLHFNSAMAYKYEQNFEAALKSFENAASYDPLWPEPKEELQNLLNYLKDIHDMVRNKGNQKARKIRIILKSLKPQHLGPYASGSYINEMGKSGHLSLTKFADLQLGINAQKVILGKVVCNITSHDTIAFSFCLIDEEENCIVVNVYNLAQGKGVIIGDSVAIAEPYVEHIKISYKDKVFDFQCIRVHSPVLLVVNGRKLNSEQLAAPRLSVTVKSE